MKISRKTSAGQGLLVIVLLALLLSACAPSADPNVVNTAIAQTQGAPKGSASQELVKATLESATEPTATPEPSATPEPATSFACGDETLNGQKDVTYALTCVDQLAYDWTYVPGTTKTTPELRHDAQSTGNGVTRTFDIGVNSGEFGILTGVEVTIAGKSFGNPCALITLAPGYYYDVTITSGRFEVYYLPNSEPRDPNGWSRVLTDQTQQKEHNLYECPNKVLNEIPLLISSVQTGFAP